MKFKEYVGKTFFQSQAVAVYEIPDDYILLQLENVSSGKKIKGMQRVVSKDYYKDHFGYYGLSVLRECIEFIDEEACA